ncbi:MAG: hypothetical protein R3F59_30135 [Myxococcota bacterium]
MSVDEATPWAEALREALGSRLVSVTVYGDRPASAPVRMCIELDPCDYDTLRAAGDALSGPIARGRLLPYVVARGELARLGDVFPVRIVAMRSHHRTLLGDDPLVALTVPRERLRTGVEQGLRNHLIRLRALLLRGDDPARSRPALLAVAEGLGEEALGLATLGVTVPGDAPQRLLALPTSAGAPRELLHDVVAWLQRAVDTVDAMEDA